MEENVIEDMRKRIYDYLQQQKNWSWLILRQILNLPMRRRLRLVC